jgi:hypothetical protein
LAEEVVEIQVSVWFVADLHIDVQSLHSPRIFSKIWLVVAAVVVANVTWE